MIGALGMFKRNTEMNIKNVSRMLSLSEISKFVYQWNIYKIPCQRKIDNNSFRKYYFTSAYS